MSLFHFLGKLFERTEFVLFWLLIALVFLGLQYPFVLIFLAVLFVLILVHEWGHFIVAKKTGMRVDEFGIGFPPKVFGYKRGETEYTLNALPIGGFVRIWGENYEEKIDGGNEGGVDRTRAFSARPKWAQALVLIAGVAMNVIFGWVLMSAALMVGVPTAADEMMPSDNAQLSILAVLPDSPAATAMIPVGAAVQSLEAAGEALVQPTPTSFRDFVVAHTNTDITVVYEKNGVIATAVMTPQSGLVADDVERPAIGVSLAYTEIKRESFFTALWLGAKSTYEMLIAIVVGLSTLITQTFTGTADFSQIAGPVGIAGMVGDAAEFGLTSLMLFTAMISLNLAVINLLPVPALDGGRLIFVAIEAVTQKEIPAAWAGRVNLIGFVFLMTLMVLVTYGDVTKLL